MIALPFLLLFASLSFVSAAQQRPQHRRSDVSRRQQVHLADPALGMSPAKQATMSASRVDGAHARKGCYVDSAARLLPFNVLRSDSMTVPMCLDACRDFLYSGVENGRECYCSDYFPTGVNSVSDSQCNSPCRGDGRTTCGARWRIEVYASTPTYVPMGCFVDSPERVLPDRTLTSEGMTPAMCIKDCQPFNYQYIGLEDGRECWCSNATPTTKVADSECARPCAGDPTKICGDGWRLSVYSQQTIIPPTLGYSKLGCFSDQASPRTLSDQPSGSPDATGQSIAACNAKCFALGKPYAGTENGNECWCGSSINELSLLVDNAECNVACTGKISENCGGGWRLNVQYNAELDGWCS